MKITSDQIKTFLNTIGDVNYLHSDDIGIVPGMLTACLATTGENDGSILCEYKVKFQKPIYVDEDIEVEKVLIKKRELGKSTYVVENVFYRVNGEVRAKAEIKSMKGE